MPAKQLRAFLKRKQGQQYWVVDCPYCSKRHWLKAGSYLCNPALALGVQKLPCGRTVEILQAVDKSEKSDLQEQILALAKKAKVKIIKMDLAMDLTFATNVQQREDLAAMITIKQNAGRPDQEILTNVMHDLVGLRAIHNGSPKGNCFVPRSAGYAERLKCSFKIC